MSQVDRSDRGGVPACSALSSGHRIRVEATGDRRPALTSLASGEDAVDHRVRKDRRTPKTYALCSPDGQGIPGSLSDEAALELGEDRQDLCHGGPLRCRGVDGNVEGHETPSGSLSSQHQSSGVVNGTSEAVEFAHHEGASVALIESLQCPGQGRTFHALGGDPGVFVDSKDGEPPTVSLSSNCRPLGIKPETRSSLLVGAYSDVPNDAGHPGALALLRHELIL